MAASRLWSEKVGLYGFILLPLAGIPFWLPRAGDREKGEMGIGQQGLANCISCGLNCAFAGP
eukprot:12419206-Karenia_brevis.AAC.1